MRKLLVLSVWLTITLTGITLVVFAPHSWQCTYFGVTSVLYNPTTSEMLVDFVNGQDIELWRSTGEQAEAHYSIGDLNNRVNAIAFSPDGKTILTGNADNTAKLWDSQTGALLRTLLGHSRQVVSVAFSPDGKLALTG